MSPVPLRSIYLNRRVTVLIGLGFASGLPSAYKTLGSTLQAWLGELNVEVSTIGLFSLVGLPFAFNFLWAPLLDRFAPPSVVRHFGRRRGWLLIIQLLTAVALLVLAVSGPAESGQSLLPLVVSGLLVACLAASQDVVADAYRTDILRPKERGAGAAVYVTGYRLAMMFSGGGAIYLSTAIGWRWTYALLASMMGLGIIATLLARPVPHEEPPPTLPRAVLEPLLDFVSRHRWRGAAILGFVLLFKLPDAMAANMTMPLLQQGVGFGRQEIAVIREWLGLTVTIAGAFIGGGMVGKLGVVRSLWLFGILQALSNIGFVVQAMVGRHLGCLVTVVIVESFSAGLVTAGFIALLMGLCNRRYSATQYAMFTSLMYGASAVIGSTTGFLVEALGYVQFFGLSVVAGLPGMIALAFLGRLGLGSEAASIEPR